MSHLHTQVLLCGLEVIMYIMHYIYLVIEYLVLLSEFEHIVWRLPSWSISIPYCQYRKS